MALDTHAGRKVPANLTREEAAARAARIGEVDYTLRLEIPARSTTYAAEVQVDFEVSGKADHGVLFVDFQGGKVEEVVLNRSKVPRRCWKPTRILLPEKLLRPGRNTLEVRYENEFDNDGAGLHKSVDPADGREYFYGQFEPFDANRVFPCFDQPDLKATYQVTAAAPPGWTVLSNSPEVSAVEEEGLTVHTFARTRPFSTYVFGLVAGPFAVWTDPLARVPSRILTAQSLAPWVQHEEMFEVTRQGFDFYEEYFDVPYPFEKYDQIFVPQFNWGAMENVGCVCFTDRYIYRHDPTEAEMERRANTILHEMAHMWFGNLVTMRWWNDLWLNESFATYMAYLAQVRATRYTGAWKSFHRSIKSWAYWQDQLPTTHPIETPVPDTDTTHTNFDGITYGKGASTLKQLVHFIGEDAFREGVSAYLKRYSWRNAERRDFIRALARAAGRSLTRWVNLWLETSGTNVLTPDVRAREGKIERFQLLQEKGNGDARLRPHRVEVALYRKGRRGLRLERTESVEATKARTRVPELEGAPAPDFVYANYEDHGFAKFRLDPSSLAFAREHLQKMPDEFLRSVVWQTVWFQVRDGATSPTELTELFLRHAGAETSDRVLGAAWNYVGAALRRYLPDEVRRATVERLYDLAWGALREAEPRSDLQKVWFQVFVPCSEGEEAQARLLRMLEGGEGVRGLEVDQDKRWSMITQLCAEGARQAASLRTAEEKRDRTEKGRAAAFLARVSLPDPGGKRAAWEQFVHDLDEPLDLMRAGMRGFWWPQQRTLTEEYAREFFREVPAIEKGRGSYFVDAFVAHLYPSQVVEERTLTAGERVLERHLRMPVYLRRNLVEANDEMARALRARSLAEG